MIFGDENSNDVRCKVCGSFLYSVIRDGTFVHVAMGTLVDDPTIRPTKHISSAPRRSGSQSPTTYLNTKSMCWQPAIRNSTLKEPRRYGITKWEEIEIGLRFLDCSDEARPFR